jgi:hypothetical protein
MPLFQHFCESLNRSGFGTMLRESNNAFSVIESVHVLSIALLFGTVAVLDLRMLGLVLRPIPVGSVARGVLPLTWCGFTVSVMSGFLLFWAEAEKMYANPSFRTKLVLLALAGEWERLRLPPWRARAAAIASLTLWSCVIIAGRAIAYF